VETTHSGVIVLSSGSPISQTRLLEVGSVGVYKPNDPMDHLHAAAKVAALHAGDLVGLVIKVSTELPMGAGVSSSAALGLAVVAAVKASDAADRASLDVLCALAHQAETQELKVGCGWMDFLACAHGGVIFSSEGPRIERIAGSLGAPVVLIDTKERRTTKTILVDTRSRFSSGDPDILAYVVAAEAIVVELDTTLRAPSICYEKGWPVPQRSAARSAGPRKVLDGANRRVHWPLPACRKLRR
jgi:mevalonate kinase